MSLLGIITLTGVVIVAALAVLLMRKHADARLDEIITRRRGETMVASRADYVEGREHIPVVVSLSDSAFYYENYDLQAKLDIARIDEVEYDSELATGKDVAAAKGKVLRIRSRGHAFEFILDPKTAENMASHFPHHRMGEPGQVHSV